MAAAKPTRLAPAVEKTVKALELLPEDAAAVQLALHYANAIDDLDEETRPKLIGVIGPSLLRVLQALGATPESRTAPKGGPADVSPARAALDELRARRNRAASVDASSS